MAIRHQVCNSSDRLSESVTRAGPVSGTYQVPDTWSKSRQLTSHFTITSIKQDKVCQCEDHVKNRKVSKTIRDPERPEYGWCKTCVLKFSRKKDPLQRAQVCRRGRYRQRDYGGGGGPIDLHPRRRGRCGYGRLRGQVRLTRCARDSVGQDRPRP